MLKFFSLVTLLFLLLLSGCNVDYVSRADNSKIYATGSACGEESKQVQSDAANALLKEYPLIATDLKPYIKFKKTDSNTSVCYDAVVTKRGWDRYSKVIQSRQDEIIQDMAKQEKIFEYDDKALLVKTVLTQRRQFNNRLESAKKIAPLDIDSFSLDPESLDEAMNLLPSVNIKVRSCNENRNYDCNVTFLAEVRDESTTFTYAWDFGEGSKSDEENATHRYESEGHYNVSLQVTDESGLSNFTTNDILVDENAVRPKVVDENSLKAYFILHKKSYQVNTDVAFDNRSQDKSSKIKSYLWKFGDGGESSVRNPKHRYAKEGKYLVKYKVCNSDGTCAYASTSVKIVAESKEVKPAAKAAVAKVQKGPSIDAKAGEDINAYIATHGQPSKQILKKKGTTKAYKFGSVWLLVKQKKIVCAVQEDGFKTTLMGQPKKCNWHKRYAKDYMVDLQ